MNAKLHPLRCETCDYAKIEVTHYDNGEDSRIYCRKIGRRLDFLTYESFHWFFEVGCASHISTSQAAWKVLDAIELVVNEYRTDVDYYGNITNAEEVMKKVAELRQHQDRGR